MFRKIFIHAVIGLSLGLLQSTPGAAQEAQYFHSQIENEMSGVDRSAGELLDALVSRPKDVRDAALAAAEHPDMIIRLKYVDRSSPDALGVVLKDYPASVAEAGRTLASHGDVIEMMAKNVAGTAVLGRVHARQREVVVQLADRLGQKRTEQRQETSEAWGKRLSASAEAMTQAASAPGLAETGQSSLPTGDAALRILEQADVHAELAAAIVDQWEHERNPEEFRRAVDTWYAKGRDVLPWDFGGDAAWRAQMLAEYARFDRQYREVLATGEKGIDRLTLLSQHAEAFPKLIDVYYKKQAAIAEASRPKIAGGPFTSGGGGGSARSSSRSSTRSSRTSSRSNSSRTSSRQNRNSDGQGDSNQGGFGGQGGSGGQGGFGNSGGGFGNSGGFGSSGGGFGNSSGGFGSSGGGFGSSGSGFGSSSGSGFGSSSRSNRNNSSR